MGMKEEAETQMPNVDIDQFMAKHAEWSQGETDAASDAGKRRAEMGQLDKDMKMQAKARAQVRAGLKIKKEGDRKDWLRSIEACLPMLRREIYGNGTAEMEFVSDGEEPAPVEFVDDDADTVTPLQAVEG